MKVIYELFAHALGELQLLQKHFPSRMFATASSWFVLAPFSFM
jgi:hypothetical protein